MELDENLSLETLGSSSDSANLRLDADVTILICSSCRDETGSNTHPRAGAKLAESARLAAAGEGITSPQRRMPWQLQARPRRAHPSTAPLKEDKCLSP